MPSTNQPPFSLTNQPLTVQEAILQRRSVRHYLPDAVPDALLNQLLGLAVEAPSSFNLQDRHLVVVRSKEGLAALAEATGGQPQPQEAPVIVVFLADLTAHKRDCDPIWRMARDNGAWSGEFSDLMQTVSTVFQEALGQKGLLREYAVKDATIAASFFMLAATSVGLATSPMNGWDEQQVKRAIGVAERSDLAIALLVSLGYTAQVPVHPGRMDRRSNVFFERMP